MTYKIEYEKRIAQVQVFIESCVDNLDWKKSERDAAFIEGMMYATGYIENKSSQTIRMKLNDIQN